MDWNARFKNKAFWVALSSAVIFVILGVVVDPTTGGIADK